MDSGKEGPPGLSWTYALSLPEILNVSVVSVYYERVAGPLQSVSPFLKGELDGKKFSIPNVIVLLHQG